MGHTTRRRKGSKKPSGFIILEGARERWSDGSRPTSASGEIISYLEPPAGEFTGKQRSPETSWLNIKQLTEPQHNAGELISTRKI